jgi:hypothetical protein
MPVVGPHIALSSLVCGREVHCVGGAYEEIRRSRNDQVAGSTEQGFVNRYKLP